jgi:hypothetical protein
MLAPGRPVRGALPLFAAALLACASPALEMPDPVMSLPDLAATRAAILAGMAVRSWEVEREEAGQILAAQVRGGRTTKIWIDYDLDRVRFRFESQAPRPDNAAWNKLARNLRHDVAREMTRRRADFPLP